MTTAITDTRAIAHDMQANAQRGLLWGIGVSLLIHMAVLTVQVGGDSFGWRAPTSETQQDVSTRMKARLVPRETPATPVPETAPQPVATEQRQSDAPKTTTVTVNASTPIPRAEELDPPIPRVEPPAALPPAPMVPPIPAVEAKPDKPAPSVQPPELVTPAKTEPKAPAPVATTPPPLPVSPPPVVEPAPPKPEVKEVVEAPTAKKEPAAPTPPPVAAEPAKAAPAAPAPSPQIAAPTPPASVPTPTPTPVPAPAPAAPTAAASAQPVAAPVATPVLAQPAPSPASAAPAAAPASAPAAASASPASAAPSGSSAPASAASASAPASGSTSNAGATGRPSATVTLPSPRSGDGVTSGALGAAGNERLPAFNMPPAKPEGFDPYKSRTDAARDAARELNNQRSRVPPSVAPSLTADERFRRNVADAFLPPCSQLADAVLPKPAVPSPQASVAVNQPMEARKKEGCRGESR